MWSHYADGARGVVIEFELPEEQNVHKVSYLKKTLIPEKDITIDKAKEILLYKDKHWKYEAESRCLVQADKKFIPIKIRSITFGSRAEESKVELLSHIIGMCRPDLKTYENSRQALVEKIKFQVHRKGIYIEGERTDDFCPSCTKFEIIRENFKELRNREE